MDSTSITDTVVNFVAIVEAIDSNDKRYSIALCMSQDWLTSWTS